MWTAPRRIYLDKNGVVVPEGAAADPVTLLVNSGATIPLARAVALGLAQEGNSGTALGVAADQAYRAKVQTPRLRDLFAGAGSLDGHAADTGQTWNVTAGALQVGANTLTADPSAASRATLSGSFDSPDQDVSFVVTVGSGNPYFLLLLRAGANNSGYAVGIGGAQIGGNNGCAASILGYARDGSDRGALAQGTTLLTGTHTILATVRGSGAAVTIRVFVDGALACQYADADPKRIVDAGTLAVLAVGAGTTAVRALGVRTYPREAVALGAIGNSIMAGSGLAAGQDPLSQIAASLSTTGGFAATGVNRAVSGTTVSDWQPGSANLTNAMAAFQAAGMRDVFALFETNEAKVGATFTPASYLSGLTAIVQALTAAGYRVFICAAPSIMPGAYGQWDETASGLLAQLASQEASLVDGAKVFFGWRAAFAQGAGDWGGNYQDGVHPTASFAALLGQGGAAAWLRARAAEVPVLP